MFNFYQTRIVLASIISASMFSACGNQHVLVQKETMAAANQCLVNQQAQQQQLLLQQAELNTTLIQLNETLSQPLQVNHCKAELRNSSSKKPVKPNKKASITTPASTAKLMVGEIENTLFPQLGLLLAGRIDTGATTSSLDARYIQTFERDGERWVRFSTPHPETQELIEFERKRVRRARINQANNEKPERRPVVELQLSIGHVSQLAEFTLSDRSHLDYPVLIGRNVLRDVMLVDVSKIHIAPLPKSVNNTVHKP